MLIYISRNSPDTFIHRLAKKHLYNIILDILQMDLPTNVGNFYAHRFHSRSLYLSHLTIIEPHQRFKNRYHLFAEHTDRSPSSSNMKHTLPYT